MAMISCRECGAQISNEATCCPQCGCPVVKEKKKRKRPVIIAIAVVLLIVVLLFKYAVDNDLIFLSADSRMEYYFMTILIQKIHINIVILIDQFKKTKNRLFLFI